MKDRYLITWKNNTYSIIDTKENQTYTGNRNFIIVMMLQMLNEKEREKYE